MNIRTQLELEDHFTDSEKEIARYILTNGKDVVKDSISTLINLSELSLFEISGILEF